MNENWTTEENQTDRRKKAQLVLDQVKEQRAGKYKTVQIDKRAWREVAV